MGKKKKLLKLNRSDFLFLAMNDVLKSMSQVITIRFKTKQHIEDVRNASRYMVSIYPRLRSVVEPTWFSYGIRILDDVDDKRRIDILFNDAFRVRRDIAYNSEEYIDYRRDLLNEAFSLEQGLPIKFRYLPDDAQPVLLISVNHVTCDGMAYIHLMNSLIAYLNGKKIPAIPVDNPSLKPVLLEKNYLKIPSQLYKSYKIFKNELQEIKNDRIIPASADSVDFLGSVGTHQKALSYDLKTILSKSRELGCSLTVFILAAISISFFRRSDENCGNVAGILLPFNLRPFFDENPPVFGNYVRATMIRSYRKHVNNPKQLFKEIQNQLIKFKTQTENKEIIFPWLIEEAHMLIGRKNYARAARILKKRGRLRLTCHNSNLGSMDGLNTHGTKCQVCEAISTAPSYSLVIGIASLDGHINTSISYPEADFTYEEIEDLFKSIEHEIGELFKL